MPNTPEPTMNLFARRGADYDSALDSNGNSGSHGHAIDRNDNAGNGVAPDSHCDDTAGNRSAPDGPVTDNQSDLFVERILTPVRDAVDEMSGNPELVMGMFRDSLCATSTSTMAQPQSVDLHRWFMLQHNTGDNACTSTENDGSSGVNSDSREPGADSPVTDENSLPFISTATNLCSQK